MPIRKEEEVTIYGTEYKIKQLPATSGARIMLQISRLIFSGAEGLGDILQNDQIKEIIETFLTTSLVISDLTIEDLPANVKVKLAPIKGQSFDNVKTVKEALSQYLSEAEVNKHYVKICQKAAASSDSAMNVSSILSLSGHLLALIKDIIHKVDADEFEDILTSIINKSIVRYRPQDSEKFNKWINSNNDYAFDEHFSGNYNEMLELFAYLILFNYAESIIMLKKNQILEYFQPYLEKIKLKKETTE